MTYYEENPFTEYSDTIEVNNYINQQNEQNLELMLEQSQTREEDEVFRASAEGFDNELLTPDEYFETWCD